MRQRVSGLPIDQVISARELRDRGKMKAGVNMKSVYVAAFHQSRFGKLLGMTVPEIVDKAIQGVCREIGVEASALDVGSIGAACNFTLNEQGLLAGLMAMTPGLE